MSFRTNVRLFPWFAAVSAALLFTNSSPAQLKPERLYYGVNRPIPMTVEVPDGVNGEVEIALMAPGADGSPDAETLERASAEAGRVDLSGLFPVLWTTTRPQLRYAQLLVDENKIGSAVVLQPLLKPRRAQAQNGAVRFPSAAEDPVYSGLRAYTDRHVIFNTSEGEIEVALRPDHAPNTCYNFINLVEGGFYTDIIVHRVVPTNPQGHPFVIQFGDPTGAGNGGPGYFIDLEPSGLRHTFGVLSMARSSNPNTNGSQVFICLSREGTSFLDGKYTAFGQTVRGAETILAIESTPLSGSDNSRPADPPIIKSARTVSAPPYGEGPKPVQRPADYKGER